MSTVGIRLLTAKEFLRLDDLGPCELVRGRIVPMNPPGWRHGNRAAKIIGLLDRYLEMNDIGRISTLDAGVLTERDPDTVRGADICYHSYERLPEELDPEDYPEIAPEIIWEVLSPGNRSASLETKISEYLGAGVLIVCVVDSSRESFVTHYPDRPPETLERGHVWTAPAILPGFEIPLDVAFRKGRRR